VVAPYWTEHAKFAADHGVKIAIEMHPGFVVYSPETMLRLRSIAGPSVGCNFDPSHLFWQSIDPIAAVRVLKESIFHVHAKDTQIYAATCRVPACSIPSRIPRNASAAGSSAPVDTATGPNGGANLFPHCACLATMTCSPLNTKIVCSRRKKVLTKSGEFSQRHRNPRAACRCLVGLA